MFNPTMWVRNLSGWCVLFLKTGLPTGARSLWRPHVHRMSESSRLFHPRLIGLTICILWNYWFPLTGSMLLYIYFFINAKKKDIILNQPTYSYYIAAVSSYSRSGEGGLCVGLWKERWRVWRVAPLFSNVQKLRTQDQTLRKGCLLKLMCCC